MKHPVVLLTAGALALAGCAIWGGRGLRGEKVALRGYGRTEIRREASADGARILRILAESTGKAALWQTKYLSDLTNTLGRVVSVMLAHGATAYDLGGGRGYALAVREGCSVALAFAPTRMALDRVAVAESATAANTRAAGSVPLYLDKWDQHAFNFYYWVGQVPVGAKTYDARQDFDFAASNRACGIVLWSSAHRADRADGIQDENQWNWAFDSAAARGLPVTLNLSEAVGVPLANAYRNETKRNAPEFGGNWHRLMTPGFSGGLAFSWASELGRHRMLEGLQQTLTRYDTDAVVDVLEPHGELNHGPWTPLTEYGPLADKSFQTFLRERYGNLATVAARYREPLAAWGEVRLPEIAEFAGWGTNAVSLAGMWRVAYPTNAAAFAALAAPGADTRGWGLIRQMPGTEENLFLPKRLAVARRTFAWQPRPGRWWLYLWDLNMKTGEEVALSLNGREAGREKMVHNFPHWMCREVTDLLEAGTNTLAVQLPHGFIGYRVYLTPVPPAEYPHLAGGLNAKWVDFIDWQGWSRAKAVEQGMAMIREVEPDKSIICMAPDSYLNQLRDLSRRYGCRFHNTGSMGGWFHENLPMLMRSAGLPFSLEPGGPAKHLPQFKHQLGLWLSEGVNAIHYFIHIGCIEWDASMRGHFEKVLPALRAMGQYHQPKSGIAFLYDSDNYSIQSWPWKNVAFTDRQADYFRWHLTEDIDRICAPDGLMPDDFSNGIADAYPLVFDSGNVFVRLSMAIAVDRWVAAGHGFVALSDTGRHTPEKPDAWAFASLCGGHAADRALNPACQIATRTAEGAALLPEAPAVIHSQGVRLNAEPGATVLYRWQDGSPALLANCHGKGTAFLLGITFAASHAWKADLERLYEGLVAFANVEKAPLLAAPPLIPKHYVSNNGLQDVWLLWNSGEKSQPYAWMFRDGRARALTDVVTGGPAAAAGELGPYDFVMATSPRASAADAAVEWFNIQKGYWQGTERGAFKANGKDTSDFGQDTLALGGEWKVNGQMRRLTSWTPDEVGTNLDFTAEKTFTVPADWNAGEIALWCVGMYTGHINLNGKAEFFLNGNALANAIRDNGVDGFALPLRAGERATLKICLHNNPAWAVRGLSGACFLAYTPKPNRVVSLDGAWKVRADVTSAAETPQTIPGRVVGGWLGRSFEMPAISAGSRIFLHAVNDSGVTGAIVNGNYVRRHHHVFGPVTHLDVTPFVKPGAVNEITLCSASEEANGPTRKVNVKEVELYVYETRNRP